MASISWNEQHYHHLLQALPAALYTTDTDGYITFYNRAAAALWGREPQTGKEMWCGSWKIYAPDGITPLPLDECPMAIALKNRVSVSGKEIIIERPDGTRRHILPHPEPVFDSAGNMIGAVNMLIDITEKKAEEKNIATLAAIVQSSNDAIVSKTLDGIITSWNAAAERIFGYTAAEMIGHPIFKIIPKDRQYEEPLILDRIRSGERVEHYETKRLTKNGRLIDISLTISPVKDSNGRIIGASKIARDITQQKETEKHIRESDEKFRLAVESTRLGTWEYCPLTGKLDWSNECAKIFGTPEALQVDYNFFLEQVYPDDRAYVENEVKKAIDPQGNGSYDVQFRILRHNDKQLRWIRSQGKVYFNEQRQSERFIGTVLDITREKDKEQKLIHSIELFETITDDVPAMIWMSGTEKFGDYFNRSWLAFTGKTLEEESDEGWLEGIYPSDVQRCVNTYNRSLKSQKEFYIEFRLRRFDGQYRWIANNSVPRFSPAGEFLGFISACSDIDDQKRFREKIQASELLLKTISNAAPVGLWMTDVNGQCTFVNDTWIEWTGIPIEKQLGEGWLDRVMEEDKINAPAKFQEVLQKKEKYSTEFRIVRQDGELRWCLTEGYPYYNASGELVGYAGSVTDITDIKRQEQRKDDFIKMASHELKTPITSISGYVQLLLDIYNESDSEKLQSSQGIVKTSLATVAKQVTKLTRLISELLDLSKIESGKLDLYKTEFDLNELVEETVQDLRYTTSRHSIITKSDFNGKINGDKDRLAQVLTNLLNNAIKYSPNADKVDIYIEGDNKTAKIHVSDYGIGIEEKDQQRIFERFYRVGGKNEQTYPGFGIGLFIASEIISRHSGTIAVKSQKDMGSVFTVSLPVSS